MNQIMSIKEVRISHRHNKKPTKMDSNLAAPADVARAMGRKPATAYHRARGDDVKMRTCAGECVNRICAMCKVECSACQKDVCAHCAYTEDVTAMMCDTWHPQVSPALCLACVKETVLACHRGEWKPQVPLPEECFIPSQQHAALHNVQRNPVARKLNFSEF
jgi:hypothetical protein